MKCLAKVAYSRKDLLERYGVSAAALNNWLGFNYIKRPAWGGYFSEDDVLRIDSYFIATRVFRLTQKECKQHYKSGKTLVEIIENKHRCPFVEIIENLAGEYIDHPVIVETLARYKGEQNGIFN